MNPWHTGQERISATLLGALAAIPMTLLLACTSPATKGTGSTTVGALPVFHRNDMLWLERVTFGLDSSSVAELRRLGREGFLDRQLEARDGALPVRPASLVPPTRPGSLPRMTSGEAEPDGGPAVLFGSGLASR